MQDEDMRKLYVKIESSTKSAVRTTVVTGHCVERKHQMLTNCTDSDENTGSIVLIFRGDHTVVGGHGKIFDKFCQTGLLSGFPGEGEQVISLSEDKYVSAKIKVMEFHETYKNLRYDVNHSKYVCMNVYLKSI